MAVHFNFILDDIDATNLMEILNEEIGRQNMQICECIANHKEDYVEWHHNHIEYLKSLIAKMHNTRLENDSKPN